MKMQKKNYSFVIKKAYDTLCTMAVDVTVLAAKIFIPDPLCKQRKLLS